MLIRHPSLTTCSLRPSSCPPRPVTRRTARVWPRRCERPLLRRDARPNALQPRLPRRKPLAYHDATGEPVAFLRLSPASDVTTTWSWGPYRGQQTLEQAKELLKAALSKLNRGPRVADAMATLVTDADVLAFRKWGYPPRFDTERLAGWRYEKFNKL